MHQSYRNTAPIMHLEFVTILGLILYNSVTQLNTAWQIALALLSEQVWNWSQNTVRKQGGLVIHANVKLQKTCKLTYVCWKSKLKLIIYMKPIGLIGLSTWMHKNTWSLMSVFQNNVWIHENSTHTHVHLSRLYICTHVKHSKTVLNCKKLHQWCIKRRYLPHSKTHQNCCTKTAPKLCLSCTTTAPKLYQNYTKTQPTRTKSARVHVLPQNYTKPHKTLHQHCTSHLYTTYQNCT